jgi:steroid delta-isomerase-like uncharacterized protein
MAAAEQNKVICRRFLEEVVNKGNQAVADELIGTDFIDHNPLPGLPSNRDGFKQSFIIFRSVFPNMKYTIEDMIAEGDRVVVRWIATGTQKGELFGVPPTGKYISVVGIDIFRLANGKLVELWLSWDQLGMMQQLGIIPPMGQK